MRKRNPLSLKRHLFLRGDRAKLLAQGFLDFFFDSVPHLEDFFQFSKLSTKAAFAKAAFDTLRVAELRAASKNFARRGMKTNASSGAQSQAPGCSSGGGAQDNQHRLCQPRGSSLEVVPTQRPVATNLPEIIVQQ